MRDLASMGGWEGVGFGLVRNHLRTGKLCLLITMSSVVLYAVSSGLSLGGYG